jgi:hypothetical protein
MYCTTSILDPKPGMEFFLTKEFKKKEAVSNETAPLF